MDQALGTLVDQEQFIFVDSEEKSELELVYTSADLFKQTRQSNNQKTSSSTM